MYGRVGLDRFKKAQSSEPFSVNNLSASTKVPFPKPQTSDILLRPDHNVTQKLIKPEVIVAPDVHVTQVGGGQSTWQPPDWAIEPRSGVFYLEVLKDGEVLGKIELERRRHIFGRQLPTCDFVLDHQSVSRQHAAVVPHKNGSIFVIDLGSVHGTFVANERLTKDNPVELEVGQSLRFAASTRFYILRKNVEALLPSRPPPFPEITLPPPPDPSDPDALLIYNTMLNRYNKNPPTLPSDERNSKRLKRTRVKVTFRDQMGGALSEIVGTSDGMDVETEPGPIGVKEGSGLVGQYESLVKVTVIPKGSERKKDWKDEGDGVTEKLKEIMKKVKSRGKSNGFYDDLYGDSFSENVKVGSCSWGVSAIDGGASTCERDVLGGNGDEEDDDDDLFGD